MNDAFTRAALAASTKELREALASELGSSRPSSGAREGAPPPGPVGLLEALQAAPRVAIAGGPRTGKTTLARTQEGRTVLSTDDLVGWLSWSELSEFVVQRCSSLQSFVVEGVRVAHALRKGLEVDLVVWLDAPKVELTDRQRAMEKATRTVFEEWASTAKTRILRVLA